jgi:putative ABC transport system permease protein
VLADRPALPRAGAAEEGVVKFLPLVWAGLWRRPVRSILTGVCILIAFVLLGLLQGVNAGFARAIANAHRELLVTRTRVRGGAPMPISAMAKIQALPGVKEVAPRAYFMGSYQDPNLRNSIVAIATDPGVFFSVLPGIKVEPRYVRAMQSHRDGIVLARDLLNLRGWKVGQRITVRSSTLKTDGSSDWSFDIVGVFDTPLAPGPASFGVINYAYFDQYRVDNRGTAELFYVHIANPDRGIAMSAAIDRIFANSPHESRTRSQQVSAELQAKQMGDVQLFTNAIMGAVLFTLAFLTGNTLRQSLEDRRREFAVLQTVGYSGGAVLGLAYAEALSLYLPPAALGLLIARLLAPLARADIGNVLVSPTVVSLGLACAACLAFIGTAIPAANLARTSIAAALGKG